ncbi:hypothetical protein KAFR_0G00950 [Kazachstania africana CBS 2517]|uniref:PH domain-containing protein n=1 Tax=Kazachstania africana (strain ATCC 22294 / BCRC 22015 / CBS 2517 / CECT 1963 / NBRC 1671 / NRRL Y-8276) TaxID=1071382 RepID=H2AXM8_KAZAF|nr:hypothetical protein KAFR_0G00950 [Kazachstania africana CBS 2517]CCF59128.1 hypothetical protein KAFR_0G00950 [Kazachstania africana CBS 2517]
MDAETTVESLLREIDIEVNNSIRESKSERHLKKILDDNISDTTHNDNVLSSPFKATLQPLETDLLLPPSRKLASTIENLSGSTVTHRITKNSSPSAMKLQARIDRTPGTECDADIMDSARPLLPHSKSDTFLSSPVHFSMDEESFASDDNYSPQIKHSPSKIPLTSKIIINNFMKNDVPPTRASSGSSVGDEKITSLSVTLPNDHVYNLEKIPSIPDTPELGVFVQPNLNKTESLRFVSVSTFEKDREEHQSTKEASPYCEENEQESDIRDLSIALEPNSTIAEASTAEDLKLLSAELSNGQVDGENGSVIISPFETGLTEEDSTTDDLQTQIDNAPILESKEKFAYSLEGEGFETEVKPENNAPDTAAVDEDTKDGTSKLPEIEKGKNTEGKTPAMGLGLVSIGCPENNNAINQNIAEEIVENKVVLEADSHETLSFKSLVPVNTELDATSVKETDVGSPNDSIDELVDFTPVLPQLPVLDPLFLDDPLNHDPDSSLDSIDARRQISPTDYLSVWHLQDSVIPAPETTIKQAPRPDSPMMQHSYRFKPKLVHSSKIRYSETLSRESQVRNHDYDDNVSLGEEFSKVMENMLGDNASSLLTSVETTSLRPNYLNIWTDEETQMREKYTKVDVSEILIEEGKLTNLKSSSNDVVVGKADSIKSYEVDMESIESNSEGLRTSGHIESPFKFIRKKEYQEPELNNSANLFSKPLKGKPREEKKLEDNVIEKLVEEVAVVEDKEALVEEELKDYGILYLKLEKMKINLSGISNHQAKFCLEIDNGINVARSPWKKLDDDDYFIIDRELEIPTLNLKQTIYVTLKCQYKKAETELVEVVKKISVGKKYNFIGKNKYAYEKRYVQRPVTFDEWDYMFAEDGSFGYCEIKLDKEFLKQNKFNGSFDKISAEVKNRWARIPNNKDSKVKNFELPRRKEYKIGTIEFNGCYIERSSNLEVFPKNRELVNDMVKKLQEQEKIRREGYLQQEGGDLEGVIKKRFFKLNGTSMVGFHENSGKAQITINLLKVCKVISSSDVVRGKEVRNLTDLVLVGESFELVFNNGDKIILNSDISTRDTIEWYNTIKRVVELNSVHQPWVKKMSKFSIRT